jgi:hypothetical protein
VRGHLVRATAITDGGCFATATHVQSRGTWASDSEANAGWSVLQGRHAEIACDVPRYQRLHTRGAWRTRNMDPVYASVALRVIGM